MIATSPDRRPIRFDFCNMTSSAVGEEHGVQPEEIAAEAGRVAAAVRALAAERRRGELPFMDLPYQGGALARARAELEGVPRGLRDVVVLGIGGSALGLTALQTALGHPFHNLCRSPRLHVVDNIDPDVFAALLRILDLDRTVFNVITKSGSTAETMSQFLIVHDLLSKRGGDWKDRLLVTTDPEKGALRRIAREQGLRTFEAPPGVGGRFSVLSAVALVPAALLGLDAESLLDGAAAMDGRCRADDVWANPAAMGALLQHLLDTRRGKTMAVMMAYANGLRDVADWFRQLWAESLGKKFALDGSIARVGQTPIKALGVTDQHSQMQLYVEGPNNKTITFLAVSSFEANEKVPDALRQDPDLGYLCGHSLNELLEAERIGTQLALTQAQRPNATITLPRITPHAVGQLLYMLEVQTAVAGKLYGVNAFDQPGVEAGKDAAYALLGRKGYEELRAKIESRPPPDPKYVM